MDRRTLFLFGCILAIVGGGAVPGPAGTTMLVLGILIALAVAASALFKAADRWSAGAGASRSSHTGPSNYGRVGSSRHRGATKRTSIRGTAPRPGKLPRSRPSKPPPVPEGKPQPPSRRLPG